MNVYGLSLRYAEEHFDFKPQKVKSAAGISLQQRKEMVRTMVQAGLAPKTCVDQCPEVQALDLYRFKVLGLIWIIGSMACRVGHGRFMVYDLWFVGFIAGYHPRHREGLERCGVSGGQVVQTLFRNPAQHQTYRQSSNLDKSLALATLQSKFHS